MPRVVIAPSVLNPTLRRVCEFDGDLETFVRSEFPNVKSWRFKDDGDTYYAVGVPGDPITAWLATLTAAELFALNIAVAFTLSFVANKLIGKPKGPTNRTNDAASPTYNIGTGQNQARLGAVIPVVYGSVIITPDYASQPYTEYENNEQYLNAIFCVGQGDVDVTRMYLGESEVKSLPDVVSWRVYKPADHGKHLWAIQGGKNPPFVKENVFTNSEVADQILEGPKAAAPGASDWHWEITSEADYDWGGGGSTGPDYGIGA